MNTVKKLEKVYESIYKPATSNTGNFLKTGSYKSIIRQLRDHIKQQLGEDIIEKIRNKEHFNNVKQYLLTSISNSEIDERTKEHLSKLVNKSSGICSLYSAFDVNDIMY